MGARLAADAVLLVPRAFVAFVMLGGLLVARRPRIAWLHLPAAAWAAWLEFGGAICPLTPLENHLRRLAGASGYAGGFVERCPPPTVCPAGLPAQAQRWLGVLVVAVNLAIYLRIAARQSAEPPRRE